MAEFHPRGPWDRPPEDKTPAIVGFLFAGVLCGLFWWILWAVLHAP